MTIVLSTIALVLSALMYLVAVVWWLEASGSDSSTAAIGLLFAAVLVVVATGPVLLAVVALVLHVRGSHAAYGWAIAALAGHGLLLMLAAMVWLPAVA